VIFSQAAAAAVRALLVLVVAQAYAAALAAALPAVVQHAAQAMGQAGAVSAEETGEPWAAVGLSSSAPARKRALF
jgi:archaellum component FlaG (FlaF/FlaG flagellin family)